MIILTAVALGLAAGQLRSALMATFVAALIGIVFVAAAIASAGHVSALRLVMAVAGYNSGLILTVLGPYFLARLQAARRPR